MRNFEEMVTEFHTKHKFCLGQKLVEHVNGESTKDLLYTADKLEIICRTIANRAVGSQALGDERLYRTYLMVEELREIVSAMAENNEVELADGLGDLSYVTSGTAVTYDIPLRSIVEEIHRSNMTKKKRCKKTNPRMRDKGGSYTPPYIKEVIDIYRRNKC